MPPPGRRRRSTCANRASSTTTVANITDFTDPDNPVGVDGNLRLQMRPTDFDAPADVDTIGWTLHDTSGALLFSSNWTGTDTADLEAAGNPLAQE